MRDTTVTSGAFQKSTITAINSSVVSATEGSYRTDCDGIRIDASKANNLFGAADTVQPPAIVLIPQIKF